VRIIPQRKAWHAICAYPCNHTTCIPLRRRSDHHKGEHRGQIFPRMVAGRAVFCTRADLYFLSL